MLKTLRIFCLCTILTSLEIQATYKSNSLVSTTATHSFNLTLEEIDIIASEALQAFKVPGASIAIVMNDELVLAQGYGYRDLNEKLEVTEQTLFPIASCTKAFTATLLLKLAEDGQITLDDPVIKYIPDFFLKDLNTSQDLTIRDLLAHRTGLARHDALWIFSKLTERNSILDFLPHLDPVFGINEEFQYNNLMYGIAGLVIEKITSLTWEEAVSVYLLNPLEMLNSNTSIAELKSSPNFSLPYAEMEGKLSEVPFRDAYLVSPGGGINSNVLDMANWLKLQLFDNKYLNENIINIESLMEARQSEIKVASNQGPIKQLGYGLGWFVGEYRGTKFINHGGHIDGFSTDVSILPDINLGIVILTNSSSEGLSALSYMRNQMVDKILKSSETDWMQQLLTDRNKMKNYLNHLKLGYESIQSKNQKLSSCELKTYVGNYQHPAYGNVEITTDGIDLFLSYHEMTTPLYFKAGSIFSGKISQLMVYGASPYVDFKFFKDINGNISRLEIPFESFRAAIPITFNKK